MASPGNSNQPSWYYADDGQQVGPIPEAALVQLFRAERLSGDTLVWSLELSQWTPARQTRLMAPPPIPVITPAPSVVSRTPSPLGDRVLADMSVPVPAPETRYSSPTLPLSRRLAHPQRQRPLWLIVALVFATYGLYVVWWMGATWAEMKQELDDENMHPIWHGLSIIVPIYGLFRAHAHFRTINEMCARAGVEQTAQPREAVAGSIAAGLIGNVSGRLHGLASAVTSFVADGIIAWVLVNGQGSLNTYWLETSDGSIPQRVHWGEWVTLVVGGVIVMLVYLGLLISK